MSSDRQPTLSGPNMNRNILELAGVSHSFGATEVIRNLTLHVAGGEFLAIVGPSGCGKTTLLNLFTGFVTPTVGTVACRGHARTVYQQHGLFPWKTVAE